MIRPQGTFRRQKENEYYDSFWATVRSVVRGRHDEASQNILCRCSADKHMVTQMTTEPIQHSCLCIFVSSSRVLRELTTALVLQFNSLVNELEFWPGLPLTLEIFSLPNDLSKAKRVTSILTLQRLKIAKFVLGHEGTFCQPSQSI